MRSSVEPVDEVESVEDECWRCGGERHKLEDMMEIDQELRGPA